MTVWHNGDFCESGQISVSAGDSAFAGRGAFETLLSVDGKVFGWGEHESRLRSSLELLSLFIPDLGVLPAVFSELLARNDLASGEARVRVMISGTSKMNESVVITAERYQRPAEQVMLATSQYLVNERSPLRQVKTLSYAENWMFSDEADLLNVNDVLVGNTTGNLAEASMSNVIVRHRGVLKTPPLSAGCLPGVIRSFLMRHAPEIQEEEVSMLFLAEVEEVWLCNSLRRMQYAKMIDGRELSPPSSHFYELSEVLEATIASGGL